MIFLTLLLAVFSHPAENRETALLQKYIDELSAQLHAHFESIEANGIEGAVAQLEMFKDIELVIADLAKLKAEVTDTAEDVDCNPDQPEDDYKLCVLMRQAQANLADIVEELLKDDGDDDDDIVDIHSISETVSVLAEEDVEDDNDSDLDAMDKTLADGKLEIVEAVPQIVEEVVREEKEDYLESLLRQGLKESVEETVEEFVGEAIEENVEEAVEEAVKEAFEEAVEKDVEKDVEIDVEKEDYLTMLLGEGLDEGHTANDEDIIESELDVLENLEKEAAQKAEVEKEKAEAEVEQAEAEKAAKEQTETVEKEKAEKVIAEMESAERERADTTEGALAKLSPADEAAAEMEREMEIELKMLEA